MVADPTGLVGRKKLRLAQCPRVGRCGRFRVLSITRLATGLLKIPVDTGSTLLLTIRERPTLTEKRDVRGSELSHSSLGRKRESSTLAQQLNLTNVGVSAQYSRCFGKPRRFKLTSSHYISAEQKHLNICVVTGREDVDDGWLRDHSECKTPPRRDPTDHGQRA